MNTSCDCTPASRLRCGILAENPIFRLAISLCPTIAVTQNLVDGMLMGIAVLFVQVMTNVTVSLFRSHIQTAARLPVFMVITSVYVTIISMCLEAFFPAVFASVGLYFQLIVAFASILVGAEVFASKNSVWLSLFDGLGRGLGFLAALTLISVVREFVGKGSLANHHFLTRPLLSMIALPAGGFMTVGVLMAFFNWLSTRSRTVKR